MQDLPEPVSFDSALDKFQKYLTTQNRSSATSIAYTSDLLQLKSYLSSHRITQATTVATEHLQAYTDHLRAAGLTPKSISRKINSLKTFFKFLHHHGHLPKNPALPLAHPQITIAPPRILTPHELKNLRDAARLDIRISAIIELLIQTGMRISELANLRLEDAAKNELTIRPQENNSQRTVPLNYPASAALQNYLRLRPAVADRHLFVTKTGRPLLIRNIRAAIDRYFTRAGIKSAKVNDLRHTFIAHQLKSGVQPEVVHKTVGHKRLSSTQKYLDFITIEIKETHTRLTEL